MAFIFITEKFLHALSNLMTSSASLKDEFQKLMFSQDKDPVVMSDDPEKLKNMMMVISNFKEKVCIVTIVCVTWIA